VDGIDSQAKITLIPRDQSLISDSIRDKGGQGTRPQYYGRRPTNPEPPPEEETPEEQGENKHLIDIKV
jgi:hypothetical protein